MQVAFVMWIDHPIPSVGVLYGRGQEGLKDALRPLKNEVKRRRPRSVHRAQRQGELTLTMGDDATAVGHDPRLDNEVAVLLGNQRTVAARATLVLQDVPTVLAVNTGYTGTGERTLRQNDRITHAVKEEGVTCSTNCNHDFTSQNYVSR